MPRKAHKTKELDEAHVQVNMSIFVSQEIQNPYTIFSPFWGENILVGLGRKYQSLTNFFSLSSLQPKTHQKCFLSHFLLFSFHPP